MAKSQITHEVVATIGEYKNRDGETKKRYIKVGAAFTSDDGNISIKLDAVPLSNEWSGFLSLYAIDRDKGQGQGQQPQRQSRPTPAQAPAREDNGDEIPF